MKHWFSPMMRLMEMVILVFKQRKCAVMLILSYFIHFTDDMDLENRIDN